FTGTDPDDDDITYNVLISDDADFVQPDGTNIADSYETGNSNMHPNGQATLTWLNTFQVDDRPGQSFLGGGGVLDKASAFIGIDEENVAGWAVARIYAHQGTFGASSEPLNAADPADTPTPGWLAESEAVRIEGDVTAAAWYDFEFTGDQRIRLEHGVPYVIIFDWQPDTGVYENTVHFKFDAVTVNHAGNLYIDGASEANNGPQSQWDLRFRIYEANRRLSKLSDTDA